MMQKFIHPGLIIIAFMLVAVAVTVYGLVTKCHEDDDRLKIDEIRVHIDAIQKILDKEKLQQPAAP